MQKVSLKTLTHSPKRQSEIIDIAQVKYSGRLNLFCTYFLNFQCCVFVLCFVLNVVCFSSVRARFWNNNRSLKQASTKQDKYVVG